MSAFKDTIAKDIKSVFINIDEFADEHDLNGKKVRCVVDKDITASAKDTIANPLEGVFVSAITIYVDAKDIDRKPVEGELLSLDKKRHIVCNVSVEDGMLVILAEVHDQ